MKNTNMKAMLKDTTILLIITLLAGLVLGFVYNLTKEPIQVQNELKIQKACASVLPQADEFEILKIEPSEEVNEKIAQSNSKMATISTVYKALESGEEIGYVITLISHEGYAGDITFLMGINKEGTITGVSMLDISETPGLGLNAQSLLSPQFADKNVASFTYTKGEPAVDSEIDAISGATITTSAIVDAVNQGLLFFKTDLKEGE